LPLFFSPPSTQHTHKVLYLDTYKENCENFSVARFLFKKKRAEVIEAEDDDDECEGKEEKNF
jgi:hypothetical protein